MLSVTWTPMYITLIIIFFIFITRTHNLQGWGGGVKTLAKIRELKTHLCYGLQRKKRTEESVKSTVLGEGGGLI